MKNLKENYTKVTENIITTPAYWKKMGKKGTPSMTSNVICIALQDELVFVDSGVNGNVIIQFRKEMEEHFERKATHLVLSHNHGDHIFGMKIFEDVPIIMAEEGISRLKKSWADKEEYNKSRMNWANRTESLDKELADFVRNAELFLPTKAIKEEMVLGPKNNELYIKIVGGHSPDSLYVYSKEDKVLLAGDNLLTCYPQVIPDAEKAIAIYKEWEKLPIDKVIPGHGDVTEKEYISQARAYYERVLEYLLELKKKQLPVEKIPEQEDLPVYFDKSKDHWEEDSNYHTQWYFLILKECYKKLL